VPVEKAAEAKRVARARNISARLEKRPLQQDAVAILEQKNLSCLDGKSVPTRDWTHLALVQRFARLGRSAQVFGPSERQQRGIRAQIQAISAQKVPTWNFLESGCGCFGTLQV